MLSPTNEENRTKGKQAMLNAIIGLVLVLAAWLIVDTVMKVLYNAGAGQGSAQLGPWNQIITDNNAPRCILPQKAPSALTAAELLLHPVSNAGGGNGAPTGGGKGATGLNVQAATQYLASHANSGPTGACWTYVRQGLCAGNLPQFCSGGMGNAYQQGPNLTSAGFTEVYSGSYSHPSSDSAYAYQAGDIVVFQPVPGHSNGHIAMYNGSSWISDYVQPNGMSSNYKDYQGGSFAVYRP